MTTRRKLTVEELHRLDVDTFRRADKLPIVVVLDNVRSLHNVGSIFRTADAFGLAGLCLCGITATPPSVEIHKTALGAEDSVAWRYFDHTTDAVAQLRLEGYEIVCLEQVEASISLDRWQATAEGRYALVVGHEVKGVDQEMVDLCDSAIEIPQYGTKHSLNVSVATGVCLWEMQRQLREK